MFSEQSLAIHLFKKFPAAKSREISSATLYHRDSIVRDKGVIRIPNFARYYIYIYQRQRIGSAESRR
jgi:hypothetical protein